MLKAANSPGHAIWLFEGADASSSSGDWRIAWNKDLSHLSVYAKDVRVPEPSTLGLLGLGFVLIGIARRKKVT